MMLSTITQPDLSGALYCGAERNNKSGNGGRNSCPKNNYKPIAPNCLKLNGVLPVCLLKYFTK